MLALLFTLHFGSAAGRWNAEPLVRQDSLSYCGGYLRVAIPHRRLTMLETLSRPRPVTEWGPRASLDKVLRQILHEQTELVPSKYARRTR